jgi:hypothetical protein
MAKVFDLVELADSVISEAVAQYGATPKIFKTVDRRVLIYSLRKAKGNIHRLTVEKDGSIIIWNRIVW